MSSVLTLGNNLIIDSSLVLYLDAANTKSYPGTGNTIYDLSLYGNHGAFKGNLTFDSNLKSFVFNGSNAYIEVLDAPSLDITTTLTLSAWVFVTGWANYPGIIAKGYGDNGAYSIHVRPQTDYQLWFEADNGTNREYSNPTGPAFENLSALFPNSGPAVSTRWHNVTCTFNAGAFTIYLNGKFLGNSTSVIVSPVSTIGVTSDPIWIGRLPGFGYFNGYIPHVMVYNKTLSSAEVLQNYNGLKVRFGIF